MDPIHYREMQENFYAKKAGLAGKIIFLFGHCEATLALADVLLENGFLPAGILDNSKAKHGQEYKGIPVCEPETVLTSPAERTAVWIVTRFYEAMNSQLKQMGFEGKVEKLVDYNTYAEYSLSRDTQERKYQRMLHGQALLCGLRARYPAAYLIFCPFDALGDIYFCMSYLPAFAGKKGFGTYAVCVPSEGGADVARLFGAENVAVYEQKELDAVIQAVIYTQAGDCFIAHQDRPYVVNLHRTLKLKRIPLETVYCCGVFGLSVDTKPAEPTGWKDWERIEEIEKGKTVILAPYAKSVTALPVEIWEEIIDDYRQKGFQIYTNVSKGEMPLNGTKPLRAKLSAMRSILERAGTFIGIRSGLCDVIRTAGCRKVALYPDYYYGDTKWKAIDMYAIDGFENIVVKEGFRWTGD